ncbi:MAG: hypothetical protein A2Y14_01455 [Verrucomicrobia bacterium GWF2_51_19]|nr:MAG: hypothetical protein A2Y14_01455 [Verrucomicrobia bacterium GWF2_51_19]HCJ12544.1 16S rRNA (guanine(527)-N(7))-methyltransferase RsmG [Opitutae bacterium]
MDFLKSLFPEIDSASFDLLKKFVDLLREWNAKINLISRKDIDCLEMHHLLPTLGFLKKFTLPAGARVVDVGTGGGFPGIPLAICFPQTHFLLVDSIGKKIRAVEDMVKSLGLKNVQTQQARAEELNASFDFILGRAVASLPQFVTLVEKRLARQQRFAQKPGIFYLKGGDFSEDLQTLHNWHHELFNVPHCDKTWVYLSERATSL